MWRKDAALLFLLALTGVLLSPGCATLIRSREQIIPVTSSPAGAAIIVDGVRKGVTPLEIRLARKQKGQVIRIESPGYRPVEIRPRRTISGDTIVGNFLLGLVPGILPVIASLGLSERSEQNKIISTWMLSAGALGGLFMIADLGGKGYTLEPKVLMVTLTKADGPPRVDTMLIDAADFRKVKWIRVHRD